MKRKKNKLSLALFSLRAFVGKISVSLYTPQCNFLTTYTRRFGTSKLLFQVLEEFHFFFLVVFSCHPGTERHFFFFHPLPTLKRLENNKRILKTPIIIDVFFFIMCSLFPRTVISSSLCARRREGFRHKYSFQDLLGLACHVDEKESWGFLCLPLISLTDAGSANQIQL